MKLAFTSLIALVIFFSQMTQAGSIGLKQIVEEFHYAVTVEWDQKDKAVYQAKVNEMHSKLNAANISQDELLKYLAAETKDEALKKDVQTMFTLLALNQISQGEAQGLVDSLIKKNYAHGASWNGHVSTYIVLGSLAFGALLTWAIIKSNQCYKDPNATVVCETRYDCMAPGCGSNEFCSCYN